MATTKQKRVAKLIAENVVLDKPLTGGQILEKTGYAPGVIKNPKDIIESDGVKEELRTVYGFDSNTAKSVVGEILVSSDNEMVRIAAAKEVFKVNGDYAPEKSVNINLDGTPTQRTRELGDTLIKLLGRRN